MSADPQVAPLKEWLDTGEILFGSDLNGNYSEIRDSFNSHTHTEYPEHNGTESITGAWTMAFTVIFSHATPARFTGTGWTDGDIVYLSGGNGSLTRLAKGTARQVLQMNAGATAPQWTGEPLFADMAVVAGGNIALNGEDGQSFISEPATDCIGFYTVNAERLRITSDGAIGVPVTKFIYLDSLDGTGAVRFRATAEPAYIFEISAGQRMKLDTAYVSGETALTVAAITVEAVASNFRVKVGATGSGPGGSGRALYI